MFTIAVHICIMSLFACVSWVVVGNTGVMVEMGDYDGLIVLTVCYVFTVLCTRQDNIPTTELKLSSQDQTQIENSTQISRGKYFAKKSKLFQHCL